MSRRRAGTPVTRAELGAQRCGVAKRIYEALQRRGRTAGIVADELGISESAVCATVRGCNHSERVLDALRSAGVPERYLFDPRRIAPAGKETAA